MNKLLTARQTLAAVDALRQTLRDAALRESALRAERDKELEAIRRRHDLLKARLRQQAEDERRQALAAFEAEEARLRAQAASRKLRIDQARKHALTALEISADQLRSQQKYENQKILLQANREHEAELQLIERTQRKLLRALRDEEERFEGLKDRARRLFRGYPPFAAWLQRKPESVAELSGEPDAGAVLQSLREVGGQLEAAVNHFARRILARLFAWVPWWLMLAGILGAGAVILLAPAVREALGVSRMTLVGALACGCLGVLGMYGIGFGLGRRQAVSIAEKFWWAQGALSRCRECAALGYQDALTQVQRRLRDVEDRLEQAWRSTEQKAVRRLKIGTAKLEEQHKRLLEKHARRSQSVLFAHHQSGAMAGFGDSELTRVEAEEAGLVAEAAARFQEQMNALERDWQEKASKLVAELESSRAAAESIFTAWTPKAWADWTPPEGNAVAARFASLELELGPLAGELPRRAQLGRDGRNRLTVPLAVKIPAGESLLFETEGAGSGTEVVSAMNGILLQLLTSSPAGKAALRIFDPVGLGQNFAGLMYLADYDEQIINRRIGTQASQIDRCLQDLTDQMEKVTQMCLRNEYETLAEYNAAAGSIAEKYHFLVVADFPIGFSETALRRLQSIAVSGPRCGVFLILHRNLRQSLPDEAAGEDLRAHCHWMRLRGGVWEFGGRRWPGVRLHWDAAPESGLAIEIVHKVGRASTGSSRVEVPFDLIAPQAGKLWSQRIRTELRVPIGRAGAAKRQYLTLGKGTQQHVLIAGKTGSGKSTLFHVIATNLALWYRPDDVEFYLVDFKKGVEFQCYARRRLPHARVVAIESDREFGLSVLERVDGELRRRGELFRRHGVQDLAGYQKAAPGKALPRTLVMIDEFQEYFVEEDKVSQSAAALLDRIVRQGRAFGIHAILGSQTLGGAYTLARTTLAQMAVRIALQCDEADAYLILDESNAAPRLLSRPGEGIYNDSGGTPEGNHPFQTVWLSDVERDCRLEQIRRLADETRWRREGPVVFEGNAPAAVAENPLLAAALRGELGATASSKRAWLGAPNAIKGPTEAVFERQSGSNLLIIGQNEETALSLVLCSVISLAAQHQAGEARFWILDAIPDHAPHRDLLDRIVAMLPHPVRTLKDADLESLVGEVDEERRRREASGNSSPAIFMVVVGLQSFKKLRPEDEFGFSADGEEGGKPGDAFDRIVREGGNLGVHVIAAADTYNNVQRFLSRKALSEFEKRALLQMSANDSAALIDNAKANQLGLHRALLYHERKGWLETFRPYSLPSGDWLDKVESLFARRRAGASVSA